MEDGRFFATIAGWTQRPANAIAAITVELNGTSFMIAFGSVPERTRPYTYVSVALSSGLAADYGRAISLPIC
jgi:hypothetical protein